MKIFCEECNDSVSYNTKDVKIVRNVKGRIIEFMGKEAFCNECGEEIYVDELIDFNLKELDNAYREKENLIKIEQIVEITNKYNIGKRPLSLLLGWAEGTISRYMDGSIPTSQYSEKLFDILNNPYSMREILEKNKKKIAAVAYEKCKDAVDNIIEKSQCLESNDKIEQVTIYLLNNLTEITPLALQKLLYYAQSFYKIFYGKFLFKNDCEAWIHGPVYPEIYKKYKEYGYNPIEGNVIRVCEVNLSKYEIDLLDNVIKSFGCYSGKALENMTHSELPWSMTREGLSDNESSNKIIEKDIISNYFMDVKKKYNMINIVDIRDYSEDIFKKTCL